MFAQFLHVKNAAQRKACWKVPVPVKSCPCPTQCIYATSINDKREL